MIKITMNTKKLQLTVEGHAMPEESGEYRQICAAASALAQGLAYTVARLTSEEDGEPVRIFEYRNDPGDLRLRIFPENWPADGIRQIFMNYGDGLECLARSHPQSVTMIRNGALILPEKGEEP